MPSVSKKQASLMRAAASGAKLKSVKGPSPKVAREYVKADRGKTWVPKPPKGRPKKG